MHVLKPQKNYSAATRLGTILTTSGTGNTFYLEWPANLHHTDQLMELIHTCTTKSLPLGECMITEPEEPTGSYIEHEDGATLNKKFFFPKYQNVKPAPVAILSLRNC